MPDDPIHPLEHFPVQWQLTCDRPLAGDPAVAFTRVPADLDAAAVWFPALWTEDDPAAAARVVQLVVAGSAAAGAGAHPGVGDFTAWVRYTDPDGSVRIRPGGLFRFR